MEYTISDILKLRPIILKSDTINHNRLLVFDNDVIARYTDMHKSYGAGMPDEGAVNEVFKEWLLQNEKNFLYGIPFNKVPLYVNNEEISYLVRWRLKIVK